MHRQLHLPLLALPVVVPFAALAAQDLVDEERQQAYFATADYDGSGWISFREAEDALLLDREDFGLYDSNRDGRIDAEEFGERYRSTVEQVGGFQPPVPPVEDTKPPPRNAIELRNTYDVDLDGTVDLSELETLINDYEIPSLTPQLAMSQLDRSGNGGLELIELEFVSTLLDTLRSSGVLLSTTASTLEELFGLPVERTVRRGQVQRPPRISGPIQPFARLDLDRDEGITVEDLSTLQFPAALPVRPATVIASLDTNGDGRLDRDEFRRAMGAELEPVESE